MGLRSLLVFALGLTLAGPVMARIVDPSCALELASGRIIPAADEAVFKDFADRHHLTLELLAPNPGALAYRPRSGYRAKPGELKNCQSIKNGPNAGLVACPPELFADHASWYAEMERLGQLGFYILGGEEFLVRDAQGELFFSDYDLLGVWDANGQSAYDENLRLELNRLLGRELVMHGPLAVYEHRQRVGLKLPVRVFTDRRAPTTAHTVQELRKFEAERKIAWVWP